MEYDELVLVSASVFSQSFSAGSAMSILKKTEPQSLGEQLNFLYRKFRKIPRGLFFTRSNKYIFFLNVYAKRSNFETVGPSNSQV